MFFVAEAGVFRDRWYWHDKQVALAARHMRLSYQPLTRRWRLVVSPTPIGNSGLALSQTFDTREEALAAVQRISHWKIAELGRDRSRRAPQRRFPLPARHLAIAAAVPDRRRRPRRLEHQRRCATSGWRSRARE